MSWETIIYYLLTATIPSVLTYFATSQSSKVKLKEIEKQYEVKIKELELQKDILISQHRHEINKLELEFQASQNLAVHNAFASAIPDLVKDFATGKIDLKALKKMSK